ncbi:hypothetical protein GW17_00052079 [Ensete ventricosum]|nr:hypothetical protein GW17_00052079 [Ensete ventricosum]
MTIINFAQSHVRSQVSIGISCTISKIQNTGHSQLISPWEVVRAWFCEKIRWSLTLRNVARKVEFQTVFHAPSRKFKILAFPNV